MHDVIGPNMDDDKLRMLWDFSIKKTPQNILNPITSNPKIIHGLCPKLKQFGTTPEIGYQRIPKE
jgi:hypothetical protein